MPIGKTGRMIGQGRATVCERRQPAKTERWESEMSNEELELNVGDELLWDPKVDEAAIAVSAHHGVITLRGTVGSFRQRQEAKRDAERVYGVKGVNNELEVRILSAHRRDDAELRGAVLQALTLDSLVPTTVDAIVEDGWITLTGTATWQFERDEAQFLASNLLGVIGVDNQIDLTPPGPDVDDVEYAIKKAMERNAKLDADSVSVEGSNGTVTLRGTVSSWADHDEAVAAAWAAPGVTRVKDHILVAY
jgi:osmotically-inducible protein OsmY